MIILLVPQNDLICLCRPQQRFTDHIPPVYEESEISEPKSILKRIRGSSGSEKVYNNCMNILL